MAQLVTITWQGDSGQTFSVSLDASLHEQHTGTATITDHPVELGSNIADHIRPDPDMLTIEGVVSNQPLYLPSDHAGSARMITQEVSASWDGYDNRQKIRGAQKTLGDIAPIPLPFISGIPIGLADQADVGRQVPGGRVVANVQTFDSEFDRIGEVDTEFFRIRTEGRLCMVITKLRVYEDMALQSHDTPRDPKDGDALHFTLAFKRVFFGATKSEPVPALPRKAKSNGQASTEPTEVEDKSKISFARRQITGH